MNKLELLELRKRVYAAQTELAVDAIVKLAQGHIESVKDRLLRARPEEVPPLQGEAYAYATVLKWIREPLQGQKTTVDNQ